MFTYLIYIVSVYQLGTTNRGMGDLASLLRSLLFLLFCRQRHVSFIARNRAQGEELCWSFLLMASWKCVCNSGVQWCTSATHEYHECSHANNCFQCWDTCNIEYHIISYNTSTLTSSGFTRICASCEQLSYKDYRLRQTLPWENEAGRIWDCHSTGCGSFPIPVKTC